MGGAGMGGAEMGVVEIVLTRSNTLLDMLQC